ncbi:MAG: sulfite exporter TauE/SafE family protein [Prosthecobacter sp.]|nr:sulfite exporter TauE/SafE family protein [Prosthecobacter sp.]
MTDITQLIQSGSAHVWLYIPVAIVLGALHGLEPGHSKTMMAAFIIAIRGTVWQAVLLGLSAAISHSLLIWVLAALALNYGGQWNAETTEPYFHLVSAALILGLAVWMFRRTRREVAEAHGHQHGEVLPMPPPSPRELRELEVLDAKDEPDADAWQQHSHTHGAAAAAPRLLTGESMTAGGLILPAGMAAPAAAPARSARQGAHGGLLLDTGHGWLEVCIFETGVPPRFRIYPCKASGEAVPLPKGTQLGIETARLDGGTQKFAFAAKEVFWEATSELPEPHEFLAIISLGHSDHAHTYRLRFTEEQHHHGHTHAPAVVEEPEEDGIEYQDAHERAHAQDIAKRFANRSVTTPQIVLFGITGGLMPCPAAFTILLVCLQIKKVVLGFALVAAFSFGLALTMVIVGVIAAWSVQKAQRRYSGFGEWMRRAPYISCAVLVLLASFMAWQGWQGLSLPHVH